MSKHALVALLGVVVLVLPFLGFPQSWDTVVLAVVGIVLVVTAFLLRIERFGNMAAHVGENLHLDEAAYAESKPARRQSREVEHEAHGGGDEPTSESGALKES